MPPFWQSLPGESWGAAAASVRSPRGGVRPRHVTGKKRLFYILTYREYLTSQKEASLHIDIQGISHKSESLTCDEKYVCV